MAKKSIIERVEEKRKKEKERKKRKRKEQEEQEKGKTEFLVGFESHGPQEIKKKEKKMRESDVIIEELPQSTVKEVKKANTDKELKEIAKEGKVFQEYKFKEFKLLKELMKEGKTVIGIEPIKGNLQSYTNPKEGAEDIEKREKARLREIKRKIEYPEESASPLDKMLGREGENVDLRGKKVYVQAGAVHTPIYQELKEYSKGKEDVEVKRKHLEREELQKRVKKKLQEKGYSKEEAEKKVKGIKEVYNPLHQLMRMYRFNTPTIQKAEELEEAKKGNMEEYFKREYRNKEKDWKKAMKESKKARKKLNELEWESKKHLGKSTMKTLKKEFMRSIKEEKEGKGAGKSIMESELELKSDRAAERISSRKKEEGTLNKIKKSFKDIFK